MVDALDLKSKGSIEPCRFESCHPHGHSRMGATGGTGAMGRMGRRDFLMGVGAGVSAGVGASLGATLGVGGLRAGLADEATLFRIACAHPGGGMWSYARALTRRLFALAAVGAERGGLDDGAEQADRLAFRAQSYGDERAIRIALLTGAVESAFLTSFRGESLPANGRNLGRVGNSLLHCLVRRGVEVEPSRPLAGLRVALRSERQHEEAEILRALGAEQILSLSMAGGFDVLYGDGVDALVFWDLAPNPFVRAALADGRVRQVALRLEDTPTATVRAGVYGKTLFSPTAARPVYWILHSSAFPLRVSLERHAPALLHNLQDDIV